MSLVAPLRLLTKTRGGRLMWSCVTTGVGKTEMVLKQPFSVLASASGKPCFIFRQPEWDWENMQNADSFFLLVWHIKRLSCRFWSPRFQFHFSSWMFFTFFFVWICSKVCFYVLKTAHGRLYFDTFKRGNQEHDRVALKLSLIFA